MYYDEISQLVAMGLPRSTAKAAVIACKGDAMRACDRAFAGDFDDVSEGEDDEEDVGTSGKSIPISYLDDDDDDDNEDDNVYNEEAMDIDEFEAARGAMADPYAGVFYSKDRVETVIEVQEPTASGTMMIGTERFDFELLSCGQWMAGCPEGGEQAFLFQIYNELSEGEMCCSGVNTNGLACDWTFKRKKEDFFAVMSSFDDIQSHIDSIIHCRCPQCQTVTCFACGQKAEAGSSYPLTETALSNSGGMNILLPPTGRPPNGLFHCANVQVILVGLGLVLLQRHFSDGSVRKILVPIVPAKRKKTVGGKQREKSAPPAATANALAFDESSEDDGYEFSYHGSSGPTSKKGTGYGGSRTAEDTSWIQKATEVQQKKDATLMVLLKAVRGFLPDHNRDGGALTSDLMPHAGTIALLRRRFGNVTTTLLQNDSLADQSDRSELYLELVEWLLAIARHESLASMLAMPHMRQAEVRDEKHDNSGRIETVITYEGMASPRELLERINIQCISFVAGMNAMKTREVAAIRAAAERGDISASGGLPETASVERDAEAESMMSYASSIIEAAAAIDRALLQTKGPAFMARLRDSLPHVHAGGGGTMASKTVEAGETDEDTQKQYENWAAQVRFEYADLSHSATTPGIEGYQHVFSKELCAAETASPRRGLIIAKELAVLTMHLPSAWHSSVFLRVDESRTDCLKALITGPKGTPYSNAPLVFDIFLPYDYNQSPPMCKIITTHGGRYRLNPNLYAEGKVCLSLLGTWAGPSWMPGQSTLLQVLISIQSLILVEEPIMNEPGHEGQAGSVESKAYNSNLRRMILKDAMIQNIKNPPWPFQDVIRTHFRLKANAVRKQLDEWEKLDDGHRTIGDSMSAVHYPAPTKTWSPHPTLGADFKKDLQEMRNLLAKLETGEVE